MVRSPTTIDDISLDLLQNILARLPAISFAFAACVSRSWNLVSDRVLCRPKLLCACWENASLKYAIHIVLNKVLSEPIRPHFVIACVNSSLQVQEARIRIGRRLGPNVPLITYSSYGIMGKDVFSDEFKEWKVDLEGTGGSVVMITVGFLPGIKVKGLSLMEKEDPANIVKEVSAFSTSVSGCKSPAAIIMFSKSQEYATAVIENLDDALSPETIIVSDSKCEFQYSNVIVRDDEDLIEQLFYPPACAALVFVMDKNKPLGTGKIQFHAVLSSGLLSTSHRYKVASVEERRYRHSSVFTARLEGSHENLDGAVILNEAYEELGSSLGDQPIYIGTSIAFHRVIENDDDYYFDDERYITVDGMGIKTGDTFRIYCPDSTTALSSVANVSNHLRSFNQGSTSGSGSDKREVFGGLIFNSYNWSESLHNQPKNESSPFLDNFPGMTLGGTICNTVIGRGYSTAHVKESQEQKLGHYHLHECSAVYLIMSYHP